MLFTLSLSLSCWVYLDVFVGMLFQFQCQGSVSSFYLVTFYECYFFNTCGFFIRLPSEFLPVSGLLTGGCASTLGTVLLCSSRAGSFILITHVLGSGSIVYEFLHRWYHAPRGIDPPVQSHVSYEASALPPPRLHSNIINNSTNTNFMIRVCQ